MSAPTASPHPRQPAPRQAGSDQPVDTSLRASGASLQALARCVGDIDQFVADHWDRAPLHRPGADAAGFADVLTVDDCDRIVATSGLRAPAFRLVKQGRTLPIGEMTRRARIGSRTVTDLVDVDAVLDAVADGATLVLQGLQRSHPPVAELCAHLERALAHPVQANAYLTPPTAAGLAVHADAHDVLVLHTHGRKQWVVHPPHGGPAWDLQLEPGDCLYLPRGVRHAARTTEVASLHVTVGIKALTWREVLRRAVETAGDEHLDRALPPGLAGDADALGAAVRERLPDLGAAAATAPPARVATELHRSARSAALARGRLSDVLQTSAIDDATPLRRRDVLGELAADDAEVVVTLSDRRLRLPSWTAPALRRALADERFTPADLAAHLDAEGRLVLVRRLVREGLLTVDS